MSEAQKEGTSKFGIVNRVMAILNIGDAGKMESFFQRSIKAFNREISEIKSNLAAKTLKIEGKIDALKDRIEDAKEDLVNAYHNIDLTSIENNQAQDSYREIYFNRIEEAENKIESLEEELADLKVDLKDKRKAATEDIAIREDRIVMIQKK